MTHRIQRQFLHVEVNGTEAEGLALQGRLPELCRQLLAPAVERVLDRLAPLEEHWIIDKLEIDAGAIDADRLEQDLAALVEQALEKILKEQEPPRRGLPEKISGETRRKTEPQFVFEAFVHFLNTGILPWFYRPPENQTLEQAITASRQAAEQAGRTWKIPPNRLREALSSPLSRERLVKQFSAGFALGLLAEISGESARLTERILQILSRSQTPPEIMAPFERILLERALILAVEGTAFTEKQLVQESRRSLTARLPEPKNLSDFLKRQWPDSARESPPSRTGSTLAGTDIPPESAGPPAQPEGLRKQTQLIEEGNYVDDAGLVLLHPFLPRFFEGLGIAGEKEMLKPERALALLHFLAAGQTVTPEYELTLPKLLCGVPFGTPVSFDVNLREEEIEEAKALLQAVIRHWEALRNTTPDGLRGNFLLRPGKLSRREDGDWLLQVEPKTHDVLLNHLPWGFGMVRLPWMERMLWVEWG